MTTFVLIHGACHGAWCWELVIPLLEAEGHRVIAPDLPGLGEDETPLNECSLEANVAVTRAAIDAAAEDDPAPVVLVGHSLGGLTISQTAEEVPDRIATLVYLTAFLLRDGEVQKDRLADNEGSLLVNCRKPLDEGAAYIFDGPSVHNALYGLCSDADFIAATRRLRPQSSAIGATPLSLSEDRFGSVRRVYIECTEDQGLVQPFQQLMYTQQPCADVIRLPADHSPFYSMPEKLVEAMTTAANA